MYKNFSIFILFSFFNLYGEEYKYFPSTKPDPFKPFILPKIQSNVNNSTVDNKVKSSPTDYDVSEYNLVGTMLGLDTSALLVNPHKETIVIKIGDKIGKKNGRIIRILRDKVIIRQSENIESTIGNIKRYEDVSITMNQSKNNENLIVPFNPNSINLQDINQNTSNKLNNNQKINTNPLTLDSNVTNEVEFSPHPMDHMSKEVINESK